MVASYTCRCVVLRFSTLALVLACLSLLGACEPVARGARVLWSSSSAFPAPGVEAAMALPDSALRASPIATIAPGNLVSAAGVFFLPVVAGKGSAAEVRMLRFDPSSGGEPQDCGVGFRGERCGLTRLPDERLLLGTVEADPEGGARLVARRGAADARTWEDPVAVSVRSSSTVLGRSRPVATPRGETYWIAVWSDREPDQRTEAVCLVSNDAGESWREAGSVRADGIRVTTLIPGATDTAIWGPNPPAPPERMMPAELSAGAVLFALTADPRGCVEEIVLRPRLGDL